MQKFYIKKYLNASGPLNYDYSTINGKEVAPKDAVNLTMHYLDKVILALKDLDEHKAWTAANYEAELQNLLAENLKNLKKCSPSVTGLLEFNKLKSGLYANDGISVRSFDNYPEQVLLTNKYGKTLLVTPYEIDLPLLINNFMYSNPKDSLFDNNTYISEQTITPEMLLYYTDKGKADYEWQQLKELERQGDKVAQALALGAGLAVVLATPAGPYLDTTLAGIGGAKLATLKSPIGFNLETFENSLYLLPLASRGVSAVWNGLQRAGNMNETYTGVPHKLTREGTGYMDETILTSEPTFDVWTSNEPDYARSFSSYLDNMGTNKGIFRVFTPKDAKAVTFPNTGELPYLWTKIPYALSEDGTPILLDDESWREGLYPVRTDDLVKQAKALGFEQTRFLKVDDGLLTKFGGGKRWDDFYSKDINEIVVHPGSERYIYPYDNFHRWLLDRDVIINQFKNIPEASPISNSIFELGLTDDEK